VLVVFFFAGSVGDFHFFAAFFLEAVLHFTFVFVFSLAISLRVIGSLSDALLVAIKSAMFSLNL
jgi:hypothetical protein